MGQKGLRRLNPVALAEGQAPAAADEVVLDKATAEREGWELGDQVLVAAAPHRHRAP